MKTLSIKQPWAWLILNGFKPVENRTWKTDYRGKLLIHASKTIDNWGIQWATGINNYDICIDLPETFETGGIVGVVDLIDCVKEHGSPWFFGPYGFVLENPKTLPFTPCRGQLGLFNIDINLKEKEETNER